MGFETSIQQTVAGEPSSSDTNKQSLSEFRVAEPVLQALIRQWSSVEFSILENRKMRRQRVDLEALRAQGKLDAHEKYIGVRVIDNNIVKDLPPKIAYLKQSRRQAIFKAVGAKVAVDKVTQLEDDFSALMRYAKWEFDFIRLVDGAELHGYDWIEVLYDNTKPGKVANNHVGAIDLIYDLAVKDVQDSRVVMRRYRPTLVVLDELAQRNGFDEKIVKQIRQKIRASLGSVATESPDFHQDGSTVHIYKVMYKERGIVMCAWYCQTSLQSTGQSNTAGGWLREPRPFWNGVKEKVVTLDIDPMTGLPTPGFEWQRVTETEYPYKLYQYRVTEDPTIAQTQGRGEMDLHLQEASCSIFSATVNQAWESSRTIWSPKTPNVTAGGVAPKQLSCVVKKNIIWDQPMEAFRPPGPDPMMPRVLEALQQQNADNINQPAWTVNNRQDSRKTAKEVDSAERAQSQINSTDVVTLSVSLQQIFIADWRIIQSQALQGNIPLCQVPGPTGEMVNDDATISLTWQLLPAGDIDFIERQEMIQKMQQDWPVLQNTPIASLFMEEYIRVRYPNMADRFITALRAGDAKAQIIQSLGGLLKTAVTDESGALRPEWQSHAQELAQIEQAAQQAIAPNQQPQPSQQGTNEQ